MAMNFPNAALYTCAEKKIIRYTHVFMHAHNFNYALRRPERKTHALKPTQMHKNHCVWAEYPAKACISDFSTLDRSVSERLKRKKNHFTIIIVIIDCNHGWRYESEF